MKGDRGERKEKLYREKLNNTPDARKESQKKQHRNQRKWKKRQMATYQEYR